MKKLLLPAFLLVSILGFAQTKPAANLVKYVNPMIGTAKMGHTYPGATMPFGMVQLSPDTDTIPYEIDAASQKTRTNPLGTRSCIQL